MVLKLLELRYNFFAEALISLWIPNLKTITGCTEVKLCAIVSTDLLFANMMLNAPVMYSGQLLDGILSLLSQTKEEISDFWETTVMDDDLFKEIKDPRQYLLSSLAKFYSKFPARLQRVITGHLSEAIQTTIILMLLQLYNLTFPL